MKLLYIKNVSESQSSIENALVEMQVLPFDQKMYPENLQSFIEKINTYDFDGIIISDRIDDTYLGLEICVRIRLSRQILQNKSYCTFFIYTEKNASDILKSQIETTDNTTASILMTNGVFTFDNFEFLHILLNNPKNYNIVSEQNYKDTFLNFLILKKPKEIGNHSLANIWGALRLAEVTGNAKIVETNIKYLKFKNDLYFMFLIANSPKPITSTQRIISSKNKKILFIDDEADKGWSDTLKEIFKEATFETVPIKSSFVDFYKDAEKLALQKDDNGLPFWDLILLDLRLDNEEDTGLNANKLASEYSGAKLLEIIKKDNKGTQVIMFTASNKAWNMRELIDMGVDGLYIKESPEYSSDAAFSIKNFESFEKQVEICFRLGFLKEIATKINYIKKIIDAQYDSSSEEFQHFYERTKINLGIAFNLFYQTNKDEKYKNYGFLQFFQILEDFVKLDDVFEEGDSSHINVNNTRILVLDKIENLPNGQKKYKSAIEFKKNGFFILNINRNSEYCARNIETYYRISALMIFRYGFDSSNYYKLKNINNNRNTKAAHGGSNNIVSFNEIKELLNLLIFILDNSNIKVTNIYNGLTVSSFEEQLAQLKNKYK